MFAVAFAGSASALEFDQDVTNEAIFGGGNDNGAFTTDRAAGVEVGLRAKLRHDATGQADNIFNSDGNGGYVFEAGVAPTQSFPTAVWSFEWSVNSDYDGTSGLDLDDLTYTLGMTSTTGAFITMADPINVAYADHSIGTNATGNGAGVEAADATEYASLIAGNNLAQNSWKPHWFATGFDPTEAGTYTFELTAYNGGTPVASTNIDVIVTPEPGSLALLGLGGLAMLRRRRNKS
jgi:hypothetical protein